MSKLKPYTNPRCAHVIRTHVCNIRALRGYTGADSRQQTDKGYADMRMLNSEGLLMGMSSQIKDTSGLPAHPIPR